MASFKYFPNELCLEFFYLCHPRDLLALIKASSSIFRVFQWHRRRCVQTGLVSYDLYCRLFYHGDDFLYPDEPLYPSEFQRGRAANFLPAIQFVYGMHWHSLQEVLSSTLSPGNSLLNDTALPNLRRAYTSEKAAFLYYLTSFGIQFALKVRLWSDEIWSCPSL